MTGPVRANALALPLANESVDLIVTSPPYFALRSYRDGNEHFDGQLGSEATPTEFLDALLAATAEMVRVLKPSGSIFVNLGDKYAGSGGHNNSNITEHERGPTRYNQAANVPAKSLMGLPWRFANSVVDDLGLVLREEIIWSKPNGLPESVTDRCRRAHEQIFHFTKQGRYFAAMDEIRERQKNPQPGKHAGQGSYQRDDDNLVAAWNPAEYAPNPLGKLPGSVWTIPSEPLRVPDEFTEHFAAFPQEIPRRLILGFSPKEICTGCGAGKRPVVDKELVNVWHDKPLVDTRYDGTHKEHRHNRIGRQEKAFGSTSATITGYECDCDGTAPTRPAVILDPFGGTGTTAMVARALGRIGVSVDLSADYCKLAKWRIFESAHAVKTNARTWAERQGDLFAGELG